MSSIIELSDIEEYNAEDFADVAKIDRDDINEDKSEDDENDETGDQWYRFIKIKPEEIDISLPQNLFSGTAPAREMANCSMIIPRNCRRKKC
ncbi:20733_t:CDS:2, partial [Rhizophagus irregularis]